jgi:hypothetical protein
MAMHTEEITLDHGLGWMAIVNTGTQIHITNIRGNVITFRFGMSSTSEGTPLKQGDTLRCEETIFVTAKNITGTVASFTLTRG